VSRLEEFLEVMEATIPSSRWIELFEPFFYSGRDPVSVLVGMPPLRKA